MLKKTAYYRLTRNSCNRLIRNVLSGSFFSSNESEKNLSGPHSIVLMNDDSFASSYEYFWIDFLNVVFWPSQHFYQIFSVAVLSSFRQFFVVCEQEQVGESVHQDPEHAALSPLTTSLKKTEF